MQGSVFRRVALEWPSPCLCICGVRAVMYFVVRAPCDMRKIMHICVYLRCEGDAANIFGWSCSSVAMSFLFCFCKGTCSDGVTMAMAIFVAFLQGNVV